MARITKKSVDALTARQREYMLWDDDIKGFGVRVHPSGRKVYLVKYRHHGRVIKKTIGPHGTVSPAAARARVAEILTAAWTGRDPMGRILPLQTHNAATMHDSGCAKRPTRPTARSGSCPPCSPRPSCGS